MIWRMEVMLGCAMEVPRDWWRTLWHLSQIGVSGSGSAVAVEVAGAEDTPALSAPEARTRWYTSSSACRAASLDDVFSTRVVL